MMKVRLRKHVKKAIKKDPELYGKVAIALNQSPLSLPRTLARNSDSLTSYSCLKTISEHLKKPHEELVEEV